MVEEEYKDITDIKENKTISIIKQVENCKPFVASSILFLVISLISIGIMTYFYWKSEKKYFLPY